MSKKSFGAPKLEQLRKRAGLTQEQLAGGLNITDHTYRNWITGRSKPNLDFAQFKALCRLLKCSPEELPDDPTDVESLSAAESSGSYKVKGTA
ncbi:MAG: helix-turn-helix transcriptional regulator [Leptolyngbyaceae cyanobacterium]